MALNAVDLKYIAEHGPGKLPRGVKIAPVPQRQAILELMHPMRQKLQARLRIAGMPAAQFIASPNYYPGRNGISITNFVQHTSVGTLDAAIARFTNPTALVSATWALGLDGQLVQFVPFDGGSYANGNWQYNMSSLTLERIDDGNYNADVTGIQRQVLLVIYEHVYLDWGVPLVHDITAGFCCHKEVPGASTACPDGVNIDSLLADANSALAASTTQVLVRRRQWL